MKLNKYLIYSLGENKNANDILLFLVALHFNLKYKPEESSFKFLVDKGWITLDMINSKILPTIEIFKDVELIVDDGRTIQLGSRIDEVHLKIDEYRSLFKGIRPKSIGVKQEVISLLERFLMIYKDVTMDDIINVTREYISREGPYSKNADNLIFSTNQNGKEESLLGVLIEEKGLNTDSQRWEIL